MVQASSVQRVEDRILGLQGTLWIRVQISPPHEGLGSAPMRHLNLCCGFQNPKPKNPKPQTLNPKAWGYDVGLHRVEGYVSISGFGLMVPRFQSPRARVVRPYLASPITKPHETAGNNKRTSFQNPTGQAPQKIKNVHAHMGHIGIILLCWVFQASSRKGAATLRHAWRGPTTRGRMASPGSGGAGWLRKVGVPKP